MRHLDYSTIRHSEWLAEVQTTWADSRAIEVFTRYLDPYGRETTGAGKKMQEQLLQLRNVVSRMFDAEQPAADIQELSDLSARLRQLSAEEMATAHHRVDHALDEAAEARLFAENAKCVLDSI